MNDPPFRRLRCVLLGVLLVLPGAVAEMPRAGDAMAGPASLERGVHNLGLLGGYMVRSWSSEDGLPQNSIECLAQSRDGFLWIGTRAGLARFDGVQFRTFAAPGTPEARGDSAKSITEDADGNLWIATKRGLLRRCQGRFRLYTSAQGLAADETSSVCPSRRGGVWVGTDGGLGFIRNDRITNFRAPAWARSFVYSVREDRLGRVWVGGFDGLYQFDPNEGQFLPRWQTPKPHPRHGYSIVTCILDDRDGVLWFGTDHGLYRLKDGPAEHVGPEAGLPSVKIDAMLEDHLGRLWVVVGWKLYGLGQDGRFAFVDFGGEARPEVNCVFEDREYNLWVGTRENGLFQFRRRHALTLTRREGLAHDLVWSVAEGQAGQLWIGTERGLTEFSHGRFRPALLDTGVTDLSFRTVLEEQRGHLWLGSSQNGLYCFLRNTPAPFAYDAPAGHAQIRALCQRRNGEVWVGTKGLLARFIPGVIPFVDGSGRNVRLPFSDVWHYAPGVVTRLFDGRTWQFEADVLTYLGPGETRQATGGELADFMGVDWTRLLPRGRLTHGQVQTILEDHAGVVWIGTAEGGLNRWQDNQFTALTTADGLAGDHVTALLEDEEATLWIGTAEGLSRFRRGTLASLTTRHGLFSNEIHQILGDELGHLWFGCNRGIFRVPLADLNRVADEQSGSVACLVLGEADGLLSSETTHGGQPSACKTRDGRLWFSTAKGLVMIDPGRVPVGKDTFPVVIEEILANNRAVFRDGIALTRADSPDGSTRATPPNRQPSDAEPGDSSPELPLLRLAPGSGRVLELHYTANCLSAPERVRFQYRLEGWDHDWIDVGRRRVAYYTNLRPGAYRFQVRAAGPQGVWNESGAALAFSLAPFYWQTHWFRGGVLLAFLGLAVACSWWVLRVRERIHQLGQEQALASERQRIARDMHDDIGSRLNQLAMLAELTDPSTPSVTHPVPSQGSLARLAREAAAGLDEIVWAVQPGKDDLRHLAQYLGQYADEFLALNNVRLQIDYPQEIPPRPLTAAQRHNLFLVAKEALHNTVKHAGASSVTLRMRIDEETVVLQLCDDGHGFDSNSTAAACPACHPRESHGLANMRHRARMAGGSLSIKSHPGDGTQVMITLPLGKKDG